MTDEFKLSFDTHKEMVDAFKEHFKKDGSVRYSMYKDDKTGKWILYGEDAPYCKGVHINDLSGLTKTFNEKTIGDN
jgi:hypothetical protein